MPFVDRLIAQDQVNSEDILILGEVDYIASLITMMAFDHQYGFMLLFWSLIPVSGKAPTKSWDLPILTYDGSLS